MAGFRVLGQNRTVLVRSPTLVEEAVELHAQATPSGTTFVRTILYETWIHDGVHAALQPIADHIAQVWAHHAIIEGHATQHIGPSGLVTNWVDFTITTPRQRSSPTPTATAVVRIPVQALHDLDDFTAYFAPVEKALAASAG